MSGQAENKKRFSFERRYRAEVLCHRRGDEIVDQIGNIFNEIKVISSRGRLNGNICIDG